MENERKHEFDLDIDVAYENYTKEEKEIYHKGFMDAIDRCCPSDVFIDTDVLDEIEDMRMLILCGESEGLSRDDLESELLLGLNMLVHDYVLGEVERYYRFNS